MNLEEVVDRHGAGKPALWSGRPPQGFLLRSSDALLIPFSLLWGGFAIFWEWGVTRATKSPPPAMFPIVGGVFVVVGLYVMVGRFFHDAWRRSRTVYVLTEDRAVIAIGQNARVVPLSGAAVELQSGRGDDGVIWFGTPPGSFMANPSWPGSATKMPPSFELAADARSVFEQILTAQRRLRERTGREIR
jgi:hypothetical protein